MFALMTNITTASASTTSCCVQALSAKKTQCKALINSSSEKSRERTGFCLISTLFPICSAHYMIKAISVFMERRFHVAIKHKYTVITPSNMNV